MGSGGAIASPDVRQYAQYRAVLTTTDPDVTPELRSVTIVHEVDTTAPTTTIDGVTVTGTTAHAEFSSEPGADFECSLDGAAFQACTSPREYTRLAEGAHTLRHARPTTPATSAAAEQSFTISAPATQPPASQTPATALDVSAPRIRPQTRSVTVSRAGKVRLVLACPGTETSCRIDIEAALWRAHGRLQERHGRLEGGQERDLEAEALGADVADNQAQADRARADDRAGRGRQRRHDRHADQAQGTQVAGPTPRSTTVHCAAVAERQIAERVVALVTGGAQGIGSRDPALVAGGARVAIGDLDGELARRTARDLRGDVRAFDLDVSDSASFALFVACAGEELGPPDILVNNAGIMLIGSFLEEDDAATRLLVDVNVHGVLNGMKLVLPGMIERGRGHLVNVSSSLGRTGLSHAATYCGSKFFVYGVSESIRAELRGTGVEVSCVMPGQVRTDLSAGLADSRART